MTKKEFAEMLEGELAWLTRIGDELIPEKAPRRTPGENWRAAAMYLFAVRDTLQWMLDELNGSLENSDKQTDPMVVFLYRFSKRPWKVTVVKRMMDRFLEECRAGVTP